MVSVKRPAQKAITTEKLAREKLKKITGDSFQNFAAGLGIGTGNLSSFSGYGFNPVTRIRTELEWIHRGSWLGGLAVDLVADDMTRAGVELKGDIEPKDIEQIEEYAVECGIWNKLNETIKWARLYGGALAVHLIQGQDLSTPLRTETIGKNQYRGLAVLDRWMVTPSLNDLVKEYGPNLGLPKFYSVTADAPMLRGQRIHYTRCIRFEGITLPYYQRLVEMMWGISIIERMYDRMVAFDSTTQGMAQLVYKAYLRCYKIKDLKEAVAAGGAALQGIVKQVQFMRQQQSTEGITLLDDEDTFEEHGYASFSGLADVALAIGQQLSGSMEVPLVKLFGQSPAGLNSTGESDLRNYYDGIKHKQESQLRVGVTDIYRMMAQSIGKKLRDGFGVAFRPLWQLTETQKSEIAERITNAVVNAHDAGLSSDKTAIQELKQSSQVSGLWSNYTKEDINSASEELAPLPEPQPGGGDEGDGDEEDEPPKGKRKTKASDAAPKGTKVDANYVALSPHADKRCELCVHFQPDQELGGTCEVVSGKIDPAGYCQWFQAK